MLRWRANLPMFRSNETAVGGRSVRVHYNAVSSVYDSSFGNRAGRGPTRRFRLLMELFPQALYQSSAPILEIGCGTGLYSNYLVDHFKERFYGLDLSPGMLARARAAGISRVTAADATQLPLGDGSVCAVFVFGALHHIPDTASVFQEVARILQPNGVFMVMEPNHLNPVNAAMALYNPIEQGMLHSSRKRWRCEAQNSGMRMTAAKRAAFLPSRPVALSKVFDLAESFMERIAFLNKLAIFDMMVFQK